MSAPIHVATLTGLVDLCDPDPSLITPRAIAHGLARINRWGGATELPLTVAQHSLLALEIFRKLNPGLAHLGIYALLHDAHEYLIGAIIDPVMRALTPESWEPGRLAWLRGNIDMAINYALGLPHLRSAHLEPPCPRAIHDADMHARQIEWSLLPAANGRCPWGAPPSGLPRTIKPLAWPAAEERFLEVLDRELAARLWERAA